MQRFEIVQPAEGAKQIATETRAKLAELAAKLGGPDTAKRALSKDQFKQWKQRGAAVRLEDQQGPVDALWRIMDAIGDMGIECDLERSYVFEGAVQALRKQLHQQGRLQELADDKAGVSMLLLAFTAPAWTSGSQDERVQRRFGSCNTLLGGDGFDSHDVRGHCKYGSWSANSRTIEALFDAAGLTVEDPASAGLFIEHFDEAREPLVAGLLTPHDVLTLRFRRVRLGAYHKELGRDSDWVRSVVNRVKSERAEAVFRVYPNDVLWGDVYSANGGEIESCMSHSAGYWDDMQQFPTQHPVDAYSSAYWGSGDNSLALVTSLDEQGEAIGRGIMNVSTGKIVRWYGAVGGIRSMGRVGVPSDSEALEGSWLALLTDEGAPDVSEDMAGRFVHPYVDGDVECGQVDAGGRRVMLVCGGQSLSDTTGWSYIGEKNVYCSYNNRQYRESAVTQQPITGFCVRTASLEKAKAEWTCPITGEWVDEGCRERVLLDGEYIEAADPCWIARGIEQGALTGYRCEVVNHRCTFHSIEQASEAAA